MSRFRTLILLPSLALLAACHTVVLSPSGDVAAQQKNLLIDSTVLMLLIIVPVIALTLLFAWHYRHSNTEARYEPDWDHSTQLELVIWGTPLLIVICLGALTWMDTHLLDPYRPIERIAARRPVGDTKAIEVDVVALDWKWLFIYPQYGIATLNTLAAPTNVPIDFRITSATVMNSFFIPALAGQIYAMPGMLTQLHAVMNKPGDYLGFSANYSGAGFSGMRFDFQGLSQSGFDAWVAKARAGGGTMDRNAYLQLERPTENEPARAFGTVDAALFGAVLNMCVEPGKMCIHEMAAIDAKGGLGLAGINNVLPLEYDKYARRGSAVGPMKTSVAAICAPTQTSLSQTSLNQTGQSQTVAAAQPALPPNVALSPLRPLAARRVLGTPTTTAE